MSEDRVSEQRPDGSAWQAPVAVLTSIPRAIGLLTGALEDIRAIAQGMQLLPELARSLATIERRIESLDEEVKQMRRGVEAMGADVELLDPRLAQVHDSLRPLHRLGGRLRRGVPEGDAG